MTALNNEIKWGVETAPSKAGMHETGVKKILEVFYSQFKDGAPCGSQLVVLHKGQVVVDRADGLANIRRGLPVRPDTPFLCFSISKVFTAACIHKLVEQGQIELDAPVSRYWPEFGKRGKETATIRQALLHQAGIPNRGLYTQIFSWPSWKRVTRNVANLDAEFTPGSKTAYHLVNTGFILGEVVRRVTGKPVNVFLREYFLEPLDLENTCMGLPVRDQRSAARITSGDKSQDNAAFLFSLPFIRSALIPSATLHSTARDLAVFFQMLLDGGWYAGRQFLQAGTIKNAVALGYDGFDEGLHQYIHWGLGFDLGGAKPEEPGGLVNFGVDSSLTTFGHCGQGTSMAWGDTKEELVVAFTQNRLLGDTQARQRWQKISDAVWGALK